MSKLYVTVDAERFEGAPPGEWWVYPGPGGTKVPTVISYVDGSVWAWGPHGFGAPTGEWVRLGLPDAVEQVHRAARRASPSEVVWPAEPEHSTPEAAPERVLFGDVAYVLTEAFARRQVPARRRPEWSVSSFTPAQVREQIVQASVLRDAVEEENRAQGLVPDPPLPAAAHEVVASVPLLKDEPVWPDPVNLSFRPGGGDRDPRLVFADELQPGDLVIPIVHDLWGDVGAGSGGGYEWWRVQGVRAFEVVRSHGQRLVMPRVVVLAVAQNKSVRALELSPEHALLTIPAAVQ